VLRYHQKMGRTALYRDPIPFHSDRAELQLDVDAVLLRMPDGRQRRHTLDGSSSSAEDGFVSVRVDTSFERRFVRMLVIERDVKHVVITPPEHGSVAPNVVCVPEAPKDAAIVESTVWDTLAEWLIGGGRLAACAIVDLARLAVIATPQFAVLIGEVAAQRALELAWAGRGPLRGGTDLETLLQPLVDASRRSPRAAEALISAHAHAAGATRRRWKLLW
jgi:hypothetical protein